MGHEVCGVVETLGAGVDGGWDGVRVVSETYYATCGRCAHCRSGRPNLCERRQSIGTHVDGAFAPRVVVPAHGLHRLPDGLGATEGSLAEPLACVCQSLLDPPVISAGDRVLVLGPGRDRAARRAGRARRRRAVRSRARRATPPGSRSPRELGFAAIVAGEAPAGGFDVVVECSGSEPGIAQALESVRRGGRIVQIGLRGGRSRSTGT